MIFCWPVRQLYLFAMSSTPRYRGRFAPSPTGPLHLGSLLAAAGSYLQAKANNGLWLVRIENIDPPREVPGATDDILRTLEAYGLYWDESVLQQSTRDSAYADVLSQLRGQDQLYPCRCSRKQIGEHARIGVAGPIYPDFCRELKPDYTAPYSLRLRTEETVIQFDDPVFGPLQQNIHHEIGDFVLQRADGLYNYQLAVVVDDAFQGITEVVRGHDLYGLTPAQIYLQQQLGYATPAYVHLPLLVTDNGQKLSKQNGARAIDKSRPIPTLMQILALLGQQPPAELSQASVEEFWQWAISHWQLSQVPRQAHLPL